MIKGTRTLAFAVASIVVATAPAAAQSPAASGGGAPPPMTLPDGWTMVAGGLHSPRGLAVTSDGTIYVAESGSGGTENCITHPELGNLCFGTTSGISKISGGTASRIVDGLISAIDDSHEAIGASNVAVAADGTVWYTIGGPAAGAVDTRAMITGGEGVGQLYKVGADGTSVSVADLAAFESTNNPDAQQPGNALPDSNPNGLALMSDGGALVADAGGNDLLSVDSSGTISVAAVFPVVFQPAPADPTASADPNASPSMIPMDPVPTSVAIGPDGAYYVGELTGFPFPKGGASVWKVVPGQDPVVYADGFTNIMGVSFAPDGSLYVVELAHDGLLAAQGLPMGGLWKVPAGGGTPELITDALPAPGGVNVAADGTVYVTTCTLCADGGGVASYKPAS